MDYITDICLLASKIESGIKNAVDYRELEKAVGYSYIHMRNIFRKTADISLSRYILARKIANTAFEIRHSGKTITDIAFEYEFTNLDTFTRAFKRYTGLTPSLFKQSEFLCGRQLICPGVYAPVILESSPLFTLRHIKEVNEMSEMNKTHDSCILHGVPKIYFGREVDGQVQRSPLPMALQSVLNYMGQNIDYVRIMAYSGAAFRLRWDIGGGFTPWVVDITQTYYDSHTPMERALNGAGRKALISHEGMGDKEKYTDIMKNEIDCGRPVIALGVVGPPEAAIITGYSNGGKTVHGWSVFQDWEGVKTDENGYFIKDDWLHSTEGMIAIAEEAGTPLSATEVLENALFLMTQNEVAYEWSGGNPTNYGGQAAYIAWARALENDANFGSHVNAEFVNSGQSDGRIMLGDRYYAALYMESVAGEFPQLAECATLLKSAADCAQEMDIGVEAVDFSQEDRKKIAALVRKAAEFEKKACILLAKVLGKSTLEVEIQLNAAAEIVEKRVAAQEEEWAKCNAVEREVIELPATEILCLQRHLQDYTGAGAVWDVFNGNDYWGAIAKYNPHGKGQDPIGKDAKADACRYTVNIHDHGYSGSFTLCVGAAYNGGDFSGENKNLLEPLVKATIPAGKYLRIVKPDIFEDFWEFNSFVHEQCLNAWGMGYSGNVQIIVSSYYGDKDAETVLLLSME